MLNRNSINNKSTMKTFSINNFSDSDKIQSPLLNRHNLKEYQKRTMRNIENIQIFLDNKFLMNTKFDSKNKIPTPIDGSNLNYTNISMLNKTKVDIDDDESTETPNQGMYSDTDQCIYQSRRNLFLHHHTDHNKYFLDDYQQLEVFNLSLFGDNIYTQVQFTGNGYFQPHVKIKDWVIYPSDTFVNIWNLVILISLTQLFLVLPLSLTEENLEEDNLQIYWANQTANLVFIFDIFLNFFTAQHDQVGNLVDNPVSIWVWQLTGWFSIDLVSSVPIELILGMLPEDIQSSNSIAFLFYIKYLKMLRLFKISRMLRIFKLLYQTELYKKVQVEMGKDLEVIERLVRSTVNLLIVCHFLASFFVRLTQDQPDYNWWIVQRIDYNTDIEDTKLGLQSTSWYWAIQTVTTVGQGDVPSITTEEKLFKILAMMIGVIVFSEFVSAFTQESAETEVLDYKTQKIKDKVEQLRKKQTLNARSCMNLDKVVNMSKNLKLLDEYEIIAELPPLIRDEIFGNIFIEFEYKIKLFDDLTLESFKFIFQKLKLIGFADTDNIQMRNASNSGVYYVSSGKVGFYEQQLHQYKILSDGYYKIFSVGDQFGLDDCIQFDKYSNDAQAQEASELFFLKKKSLFEIIKKFNLFSQVKIKAFKGIEDTARNRISTYIVLNQLSIHTNQLIKLKDIEAYKREFDIRVDHRIFYMNKAEIFNQDNIEEEFETLNWWQDIMGSIQDDYIYDKAYHSARHSTRKVLSKVDQKFTRQVQEFTFPDNVSEISTSQGSSEDSFGEGKGKKKETKAAGIFGKKKPAKKKMAKDPRVNKREDIMAEVDADPAGLKEFMKLLNTQRKVKEYIQLVNKTEHRDDADWEPLDADIVFSAYYSRQTTGDFNRTRGKMGKTNKTVTIDERPDKYDRRKSELLKIKIDKIGEMNVNEKIDLMNVHEKTDTVLLKSDDGDNDINNSQIDNTLRDFELLESPHKDKDKDNKENGGHVSDSVYMKSTDE